MKRVDSMSGYKISIIIPVYNVEKFIQKAMESLLNQTIGFKNLEVIFADDCSSDDSGTIIDKYAESYENVAVIHLKTNSGAAGIPRNEAMKLATSDYVMFLDPDDYYEEDACEFLYHKIVETGCDLISGYYSEVDEAGTIKCEKTENYARFEEKELSVKENYREILMLQNAFWCKIYKRSIIVDNQIEFPPYIPGQDTVFLCCYLLSCDTVCYVDQKISYYRLREKNEKSISNNCDALFFNGIQTCYKMIYDYMTQNGKSLYFAEVIIGTLDFYLLKMLDSNTLTDTDIGGIINGWKWLFDYFAENDLAVKTPFAKVIYNAVFHKGIDSTVSIIKELKILRQDLLKVVEGRNWLADQSKNKDQAIKDLKKWIDELEKAKNYHINLNKELEDAKVDLENQLAEKSSKLEELRKWANDLEEAKNYFIQRAELFKKSNLEIEEVKNHYINLNTELQEAKLNLEEAKLSLENQLVEKDGNLDELRKWANDLEEAKNYHISRAELFENKYNEERKCCEQLDRMNKKLDYYLKEEIKKPWYKKIFKKTNVNELKYYGG